ncbi:MAG: hypothetical protein M3550_06560, partial [Actinomycetota bacterium]|nr:hypothetical protein [Actinomycetota bacterium]
TTTLTPICASSRVRNLARAAQAQASALRTIERLGRPQQEVPPMPEGGYPHEPGDAFYQLDWMLLREHPQILQRHWELAWREGRA